MSRDGTIVKKNVYKRSSVTKSTFAAHEQARSNSLLRLPVKSRTVSRRSWRQSPTPVLASMVGRRSARSRGRETKLPEISPEPPGSVFEWDSNYPRPSRSRIPHKVGVQCWPRRSVQVAGNMRTVVNAVDVCRYRPSDRRRREDPEDRRRLIASPASL